LRGPQITTNLGIQSGSLSNIFSSGVQTNLGIINAYRPAAPNITTIGGVTALTSGSSLSGRSLSGGTLLNGQTSTGLNLSQIFDNLFSWFTI
jgi:hypothetical protein